MNNNNKKPISLKVGKIYQNTSTDLCVHSVPATFVKTNLGKNYTNTNPDFNSTVRGQIPVKALFMLVELAEDFKILGFTIKRFKVMSSSCIGWLAIREDRLNNFIKSVTKRNATKA